MAAASDDNMPSQQTMNSPSGSPLAEMSPMTNLAFNLSGLSTQFSASSFRKVSWTVSTPQRMSDFNESCGSEGFCTDSPMFQEGVLRGVKANQRKHETEKSNALLQASSCDKENIPSFRQASCSSTRFLSSVTKSVFSDSSEDSGYSGTMDKVSQNSLVSSSSFLNGESSVFSDEDEFDKIIEADERFGKVGSPNIPLTMKSLLTKPLSSSSEANRIRKCLSSIEANISTTSCTPVSYREKSETSVFRVVRRIELDSDANNNNIDNAEDESVENEDIHKVKKLSTKRFDPPAALADFYNSKRRKSSPLVEIPGNLPKNHPTLIRCYSETAATIMKAVQKSDEQPNLIGDFTRPYVLPLVRGSHDGLQTISSETLVNVMKGEYCHFVKSFTVVDCRYPYEYEGGHIKGAKNVFTEEDIYQIFLSNAEFPDENGLRNIIVFHCEFSSKRAPKLLRFLRKKDRKMNEDCYPRLHHPEVYILHGGYKEFYANYKEYCEPQDYMPMLHKDHSSDLLQFRAKSRSWSGDNKSRARIRSGLKF